MPIDNYERRLSTVEANYINLSDSLDEIKDCMSRLFSETGDIKTGIALVVQNQKGMTEYQVKCDAERSSHEKRITATEGFQGRLVKFAIAVTGIGSLASPTLSRLWEKLMS